MAGRTPTVLLSENTEAHP